MPTMSSWRDSFLRTKYMSLYTSKCKYTWEREKFQTGSKLKQAGWPEMGSSFMRLKIMNANPLLKIRRGTRQDTWGGPGAWRGARSCSQAVEMQM